MINIRSANLEDLQKLTAIEAECFPPAEAASESSLAARLEVYPEYFWIVEEDGVVMGFLTGPVINQSTIDDEMYSDASCHSKDYEWQTVFGINTLPDYRKRGLGAVMMNAMIDRAKEENRKGCTLTCKDKLVHYYESFGFKNTGASTSTHGGAQWNNMLLEF